MRMSDDERNTIFRYFWRSVDEFITIRVGDSKEDFVYKVVAVSPPKKTESKLRSAFVKCLETARISCKPLEFGNYEAAFETFRVR